MRNGEQLTDVHITAAQKLIQKQFQQLHARLLTQLLSQGDQLLAIAEVENMAALQLFTQGGCLRVSSPRKF